MILLFFKVNSTNKAIMANSNNAIVHGGNSGIDGEGIGLAVDVVVGLIEGVEVGFWFVSTTKVTCEQAVNMPTGDCAKVVALANKLCDPKTKPSSQMLMLKVCPSPQFSGVSRIGCPPSKLYSTDIIPGFAATVTVS